jgi:GNAT superfamily N-acetyltransferase
MLAVDIRTTTHPQGKTGWVVEARVPEAEEIAEAGSLAGYVWCSSRPDPSDDGGYLVYVHMVETNPAYARRGVASRLLRHVLDTSRDPVTHGGFTPDGAALWEAVTGEPVRATERSTHVNTREWRYA